MASGIWSTFGFRFYLDIHDEEAGRISALLIQAVDSDSDDPVAAGKESQPGDITKRIRQRRPHPTMAIVERHPPGKQAVIRDDDAFSSVNSETSYTAS